MSEVPKTQKVESSKTESPGKQIPLMPSPALRKKQSVTKDQFEVLGKIGRGAYGNVYLARKDDKYFAMKQIEKKRLAKQHKQYQALIERELLSKIKHPGVVQLYFTFQDTETLYFILEYCDGGSFTEFIKTHYNQLTNQIKVFYIAEIVSILQYLHRHGITHRDLKPENLMLSKEGHIKLIDFGTAQISRCDFLTEDFKQKIKKQKKYSTASSEKEEVNQLNLAKSAELSQMVKEGSNISRDSAEGQSPTKKGLRRSTFVGTAYYISPELIEENICEAPSDLWALGCIIYQMFYLDSPFKDSYQYVVFERIKQCKVDFPKNQYITEDAISLIKNLLQKDPQKRLGCGQTEQLNYSALKKHSFFKNINFNNIFQQAIPDTKDEIQMKAEDIAQHNQKIQRTKTELQQIMVNQIVQGKDKQKILIHGCLQKKTFITYNLYYFIVYQDLTVKRVKCDSLEKEKIIQIRWKPATVSMGSSINMGSSVNMGSSIKLFSADSSSSPVKDQKATMPCTICSGQKFQLITDDKMYTLKATTHEQAVKWVKVINERALQLRSQWIVNSSDSD